MIRTLENLLALAVVIGFVLIAFAIAGPAPAAKDEVDIGSNVSFVRLPVTSPNHHSLSKHGCDALHVLAKRDDMECSFIDWAIGQIFYFTDDPYSGNDKDIIGVAIVMMAPIIMGGAVVMGYYMLTAFRLPRHKARKMIERAGAEPYEGRTAARKRH